MKKIFTIAVVMTLALGLSQISWAATQSQSVTASASVQSALNLQVTITETVNGTQSSTPLSAMNFGQLTANQFGGMDPASGRFFTVYLTGQTQTLPYVISQTGAALSNGATTLPTGAQFVVPVYNPSDNGNATLPAGAVLGTNGTWVATNKTLYDSENTNAQARTIQAQYYLRGDPALGAGNFIPSSQASGNYTGQITYTITV